MSSRRAVPQCLEQGANLDQLPIFPHHHAIFRPLAYSPCLQMLQCVAGSFLQFLRSVPHLPYWR